MTEKWFSTLSNVQISSRVSSVWQEESLSKSDPWYLHTRASLRDRIFKVLEDMEVLLLLHIYSLDSTTVLTFVVLPVQVRSHPWTPVCSGHPWNLAGKTWFGGAYRGFTCRMMARCPLPRNISKMVRQGTFFAAYNSFNLILLNLNNQTVASLFKLKRLQLIGVTHLLWRQWEVILCLCVSLQCWGTATHSALCTGSPWLMEPSFRLTPRANWPDLQPPMNRSFTCRYISCRGTRHLFSVLHTVPSPSTCKNMRFTSEARLLHDSLERRKSIQKMTQVLILQTCNPARRDCERALMGQSNVGVG